MTAPLNVLFLCTGNSTRSILAEAILNSEDESRDGARDRARDGARGIVTPMARRLLAEGLGTAFLLAAVIGSGVMAQRLTSDTGLMLLANSLSYQPALIRTPEPIGGVRWI